MKNYLVKIFLLLGYCVPYVFLAMNEDVSRGTLWFYLIMVIVIGCLCFGSLKSKNRWIVFWGNILSYGSSCVFTYFFQTEKWGWYFKPFTPYQSITFEMLVAFIIQMIFVICSIRKDKKR